MISDKRSSSTSSSPDCLEGHCASATTVPCQAKPCCGIVGTAQTVNIVELPSADCCDDDLTQQGLSRNRDHMTDCKSVMLRPDCL